MRYVSWFLYCKSKPQEKYDIVCHGNLLSLLWFIWPCAPIKLTDNGLLTREGALSLAIQKKTLRQKNSVQLSSWKWKRLFMIQTFNRLVLRNKCETNIVYKRNEEEKKEIQQIWHLEIFPIIECFLIEKKKVNTTWCLKSICFSFQNIFFVVKLS